MFRGIVVVILLVGGEWSFAQDLRPEALEEHTSKVAELEETVSRLERQVDALSSQSTWPLANGDLVTSSADSPAFTHGVVYDGGWILRPVDPEGTPYELKISFFNQFRYTGFDSDQDFVINSAGNPAPTPSRNSFDINRGRIVFSGYAIDPLLEYYANIDYNTVDDQQIQMLLAWIRHPFDPAFNVAYGLGKVPGTWEWQESSRNLLRADASLATTFFRPSITAAVWADGDVGYGLNYKALIGNGFNTFSLNSSLLDTNFVYSGMLGWEPLGDFGIGFSDFELHDSSVVRFGQAFTYSRQAADPLGEPGPEQTVIRLSDGTRLVEPGALAPGVTVNQFDINLYAIHAGWKRQGLNLSGEYFFRWLSELRATGAIPQQSIYDHGFFVQSGIFVVPKSLEVFGIGSSVMGPFGNGSELGGGFNWYVNQKRNWRFTLDAVQVDNSPAQQDRTGFVAGASGLLVRSQVSVEF